MSPRARWISYFSDPLEGTEASDPAAVLGGKGAGLKQMTLAGIPVPPGFTITTGCCAEYVRRGRSLPDGLEDEIRANMTRLEGDTGLHFGQGPAALLVSVRSGAAVSMPGMMDTILNCGLGPAMAGAYGDAQEFWGVYAGFVRAAAASAFGVKLAAGATAERTGADVETLLSDFRRISGRDFPRDPWQALMTCVTAVLESWNSERASAYRERHDIRGLPGTAVNIQLMYPSAVSGVVFTRDPAKPEADVMVVEASYGLGESVVSGNVAPDRFTVDRHSDRVVCVAGHKIGVILPLGVEAPRGGPDDRSLTDTEALKLRDLALSVERMIGNPADIEFGFHRGDFAILQVRKIRGMDAVAEMLVAREEAVKELVAEAGAAHRCWVVHNLSETLRFPTPMTWSIIRHFMSGAGGFGGLYRRLGYRPAARVMKDGFLRLICGRIYADPERLAGLFWDGIPFRYDVPALVADPSLINGPPNRFVAEEADGRFLVRLPMLVWTLLAVRRASRRLLRDAEKNFNSAILPRYLEFVKARRAVALGGLGDGELMALLDENCRTVLDEFGTESLLPGFAGGLAFDSFRSRLELLMGVEAGGRAAAALVAGGGNTTLDMNTSIREVAAGRSSFEELVARFGHRAIGEMELARPRWREDRAYLEKQVARAASTERSVEAQPGNTVTALEDILAEYGASSMREEIQFELETARRLLPYRETGKHYLMMGYELIRNVLEELARRWEIGGLIYFLEKDELKNFTRESAGLARVAEQRRLRWQAVQRIDVPEVVDSRDIDSIGRPVSADGRATLEGQAVSPGVATGPAAVVFSPADADMPDGAILICPSTDPAWTPLFMHAAGVVFERGGVLSHGAIVARDFGIPALVIRDATRLVKSGARVRLDANAGRLVMEEQGHD